MRPLYSHGRPLSNEDLVRLAPSIGAVRPRRDVSDRYMFMPTLEVVDVLRTEGWVPVQAHQSAARLPDNRIFTKHLIRLQRNDLVVGEDYLQTVLINSHDRSSMYHLMLGIWRMICSNGMMTGDTFDEFSVRHTGTRSTGDQVVDASRGIIQQAPQVAKAITEWKGIELTKDERGVYASTAHEFMYKDKGTPPIRPEQLLYPRRTYDSGKSDLWTTFNVIQENAMKGGIAARTSSNRRTHTRAVKSIDRDVKLNRALWTMAEKMAELKKAA